MKASRTYARNAQIGILALVLLDVGLCGILGVKRDSPGLLFSIGAVISALITLVVATILMRLSDNPNVELDPSVIARLWRMVGIMLLGSMALTGFAIGRLILVF